MLFENLRMCDRTFFCSLKMCECAIAHFFGSLKMCECVIAHYFAIWKSAKKCAIAHSLFQKEWTCKNVWKMCEFPNRTFLHKKRAIAHFQNVRLPNLVFKERQNLRSHICTFSKSENVRCANVRLPNPDSTSWLSSYQCYQIQGILSMYNFAYFLKFKLMNFKLFL